MPPFVEETSTISTDLQPEGGDWSWVCFQGALKGYSKVNVFETALQLKGREKRSSKAAPWSAQLLRWWLGNISSIWGAFPVLEVRLGLKSPDEPIKGVMECTKESKVGIFFPDSWFLTSSVSNRVWLACVNEGCVWQSKQCWKPFSSQRKEIR